MNQLRRLALAISLVTVLAGTALGQESNPPYCANPGETSGPPCSSQFETEETSEAITSISNEVEVFIQEATTYGIEALLTFF